MVKPLLFELVLPPFSAKESGNLLKQERCIPGHFYLTPSEIHVHNGGGGGGWGWMGIQIPY